MYVHRQARAIYLANPRTASRSTARALEGIGFIMDGSHHSWDEGRARGYRVIFTTVRRIEDTVESWCRHFRMPEHTTWPEVMRMIGATRPIIPGWPDWTLFPHVQHANRILHFEALELELNLLLRELGLPRVELPHIR